MGTTKTQIFTAEQNELAIILKVLANPARIAILQYISNQRACICNDIVEEIGLAQPTISQHLKELKKAGLIQGTVDPPRVKYCINRENWEEAKRMFAAFFKVEQ